MMKRIISLFLCVTFLSSTVSSSAQVMEPLLAAPSFNSPVALNGPLLKGLRIDPNKSLNLNFIIDTVNNDPNKNNADLELDAKRLIRYFLAGLTIPADELWVNLNPNEPDRITTATFGQTEMGRDLLAQDYVLKQLSASLLTPDNEIGRKFWDEVYTKFYKGIKATEGSDGFTIPTNILSKVWIVPNEAVIVEKGNAAFVKKATLKVMMDENFSSDVSVYQFNTLKQILLPAIERQVNEGPEFIQLRQIYHSLLLATWMKRKIFVETQHAASLRTYINGNKISGIDIPDKQEKQKIFAKYLNAFTDGINNYIREEYNSQTQQIVTRKYFTGGAGFENLDKAMRVKPMNSDTIDFAMKSPYEVNVNLSPINITDGSDHAQIDNLKFSKEIKNFLNRAFIELSKINKDSFGKQYQHKINLVVRNFLQFDYPPKNKLFKKIDQLSNEKKIALARRLLDQEYNKNYKTNVKLEQFLLLEKDDSDENLQAFTHLFGNYLLFFLKSWQAKESLRIPPEDLARFLTAWKTMYALLWAAEILNPSQDGLSENQTIPQDLAMQSEDPNQIPLFSQELIAKHQALSDQEIVAFKKEFPQFNWRMASEVPWIEVIRGIESAQEQGPSDDAFVTTLYKSKENQQIYWDNNVVVRRKFLFLLKDIMSIKEFNRHHYATRLSEMHYQLRHATGDYSSDNGGNDGKHAGQLNYPDSRYVEESFEALRAYCDLVTSKEKLASDEVAIILKQYRILLQTDLFDSGNGNNSLYMNMVNGLLRLSGIYGINHLFLDSIFRDQMFVHYFLMLLQQRNPHSDKIQLLSESEIDHAMRNDDKDLVKPESDKVNAQPVNKEAVWLTKAIEKIEKGDGINKSEQEEVRGILKRKGFSHLLNFDFNEHLMILKSLLFFTNYNEESYEIFAKDKKELAQAIIGQLSNNNTVHEMSHFAYPSVKVARAFFSGDVFDDNDKQKLNDLKQEAIAVNNLNFVLRCILSNFAVYRNGPLSIFLLDELKKYIVRTKNFVAQLILLARRYESINSELAKFVENCEITNFEIKEFEYFINKWETNGVNDYETIKIKDAIEDLIAVFNNSDNQTIKFNYNVERRLYIPFKFLRYDLYQLLKILIDNARQAEDVNRPLELVIDLYFDGKMVEMRIKDNGKGMNSEQLAQIRQGIAFTTKGEFGNGQGLLAARQIVNKYEGTMDVESTESEGTAFILRFPVAQSEESQDEDSAMLQDSVDVGGINKTRDFTRISNSPDIGPIGEFEETDEINAIETLSQDSAQLTKGGIDFNTDKLNLTVESDSASINAQSTFDQALLNSIQNFTGFEPIIISIRPLSDLNAFFGI